MTKITLIIGYGATALPLLRRIAEQESKALRVDVLAVSDVRSVEHLDFIESSDAVFIYSHDLPEETYNSLKRSRAKIIAPTDPYLPLTNVSHEVLVKADLLHRMGGEANLRKLVRLLASLAGVQVEVGEPEEIPWLGIYHPRLGTFVSLKEYLDKYHLADRPLVGILFHRTHWLYKQLKPVDMLVQALEQEGLGVIPVFTHGYKAPPSCEGKTKEDALRLFFIDGKPAVEALVNLTFFFLTDHGRVDDNRFRVVKGIELLKQLNVPVIQVAITFYRTIEEWLESEQGLDYLSQVYTVIMPEVDGLIEGLYYMGCRVNELGVKTYEPYSEHARYLAKRVKRWIELRRKKSSQRKIAIVLINPPCKGLEANLAVGMGLDVPESIVRFLRYLKESGYHVSDELPENGQALINLIMERKAISEFRWTTVDEIVKCGGAVALIDKETYLQWFEELPELARKRMVEVWGNPQELFSGKAPRELAGMVYEGKLVVPGVLFGNVFITPQPKFGCAGPACDGRICKILHDPTIPPPHQWLAVYRWITRVFKADVLIHFGTHGYLEFRPGKAVGLSPACWPEISIDDVPHLYVYVVANPMEGVIAKRRSYAALVDHLYPPMGMADVLDELDDLLNQYSRAKQLGEHTRLHVIHEKLVEAAQRYNVPLSDPQCPDTVAEEIHRYIDAVRGSQVNLGLHILGDPPADLRRLAEYVVTSMEYDSHYSPSIIRVLAESLGLDYDELKRNPLDYNHIFKAANREILSKLHKVAVNTLQKMLMSSDPSRVDVIKLLVEELENVLGNIED